MTHLLARQALRNQCAVDMRRRLTQETAADEVEILLTGGRISIIHMMSAFAVTPNGLTPRRAAAFRPSGAAGWLRFWAGLKNGIKSESGIGRGLPALFGMVLGERGKATGRLGLGQRQEAAASSLA